MHAFCKEIQGLNAATERLHCQDKLHAHWSVCVLRVEEVETLTAKLAALEEASLELDANLRQLRAEHSKVRALVSRRLMVSLSMSSAATSCVRQQAVADSPSCHKPTPCQQSLSPDNSDMCDGLYSLYGAGDSRKA